MYQVGDKVRYVTPWKIEQGIVKEVVDDQNVRVVYHCDGDWDNFMHYTGALTYTKDLVNGW